VAGELVAVAAGGGIAGLASAVALAQAGWQVTVLERAPEFGEVGAGLGFTSNGMTALQALGVAEAVRAAVCVGRIIAAPAAAGADLAAALGAFDRTRWPRCRQLARQALLLARLGFEVGPGWRQAARNTLLRLLPAGPAFKAGARITRWTPPD
jgi:glycine/D-amino acid oxidase-like deaminating enzyme